MTKRVTALSSTWVKWPSAEDLSKVARLRSLLSNLLDATGPSSSMGGQRRAINRDLEITRRKAGSAVWTELHEISESIERSCLGDRFLLSFCTEDHGRLKVGTVIDLLDYLKSIEEKIDSPGEWYLAIQQAIIQSESEPVNLGDLLGSLFARRWSFKGRFYEVSGDYSEDEFRLLILEEFDKERRLFEKLRQKFDSAADDSAFSRPRIPETVRIEVWRRDSGKCARCGSREKLEYDHIVPISRGGSNTVRNIELLCERCNRSKSNNIA